MVRASNYTKALVRGEMAVCGDGSPHAQLLMYQYVRGLFCMHAAPHLSRNYHERLTAVAMDHFWGGVPNAGGAFKWTVTDKSARDLMLSKELYLVRSESQLSERKAVFNLMMAIEEGMEMPDGNDDHEFPLTAEYDFDSYHEFCRAYVGIKLKAIKKAYGRIRQVSKTALAKPPKGIKMVSFNDDIHSTQTVPRF